MRQNDEIGKPTYKSPQSEVAETLPLIGRYQAAWNEHGVRVAQRQAVMQTYVAAVAVIYGFWFNKTNGLPNPTVAADLTIDDFLLIAITALTVVSSLLMSMHNDVMRRLSTFMKNCEQIAHISIEATMAANKIGNAGKSDNLFYFRDESGNKVAGFHTLNRFIHRLILAAILSVTNFAAFYLTRESVSSSMPYPVFWICGLCWAAGSLYLVFREVRVFIVER